MKSLNLLAALFLTSIFAYSQKASTNTNATSPAQNWNETAVFLAGLTGKNDPTFGGLAKSPEYQHHVQEMHRIWVAAEKDNLGKIEAWRKTEMPKEWDSGNVFYPLSGADFLNASAFFPNATNYLMVALEAVGGVARLETLSSNELKAGLYAIRAAVGNMVGINYFQTRILTVNSSNASMGGILPLFLVMISRLKYEIKSVDYVKLDDMGKVVVGQDGAATGVVIGFAKDGVEKNLTYFPIRLGDDSVSPSTKEGKFFLARAKGATIMKAAIYLFFENGFEALSQYILDRSTVVVQDDSGLPYKYFTPNLWEERLYGMYRRPGGVGGVDKVPYQKDLEKSYANASKPFDFLYGYGILWGKDRCNLMVFHKKSTEPQPK